MTHYSELKTALGACLRKAATLLGVRWALLGRTPSRATDDRPGQSPGTPGALTAAAGLMDGRGTAASRDVAGDAAGFAWLAPAGPAC